MATIHALRSTERGCESFVRRNTCVQFEWKHLILARESTRCSLFRAHNRLLHPHAYMHMKTSLHYSERVKTMSAHVFVFKKSWRRLGEHKESLKQKRGFEQREKLGTKGIAWDGKNLLFWSDQFWNCFRNSVRGFRAHVHIWGKEADRIFYWADSIFVAGISVKCDVDDHK